MSRHLPALAVLLVLSACGSPTSPGSIQAHLDTTTPALKVNGVPIPPGSTTNVGIGATVDFRVDYTNRSGQFLHLGLLLVRDDGVERLLSCGVTGSGGEGGAFGTSTTFFADDRGHTVRVLLLGAYGQGSQQCLLESSPFQVNHANVQAERLLVTLAVQ